MPITGSERCRQKPRGGGKANAPRRREGEERRTMAASSPHRSAAPHLQTPRSLGTIAFPPMATRAHDQSTAFLGDLMSAGLPQPCGFASRPVRAGRRPTASSGQSPRGSLLVPIRLGPRTRQRARPAQLRGRLARKIPEPQILNVLGSLDPPGNCHVCALRPPSPRQGSTTTPIALARHELLDVSCRYQLRWWRSKIGNRRAGG